MIAPDLVMTNHHVATDDGVPAVYLEVETGPDYSAPVGATVLAYSSRYDVAILKTSRPLQVEPLKFAQSAPGIGTDINAFGFPTGAAFGKGLTTSKGNIMRLPTMDTGNINSIFGDAAVASSLWHSCQVNAGSSGGPLLSNSGIVVGVEWGAINPWRYRRTNWYGRFFATATRFFSTGVSRLLKGTNLRRWPGNQR